MGVFTCPEEICFLLGYMYVLCKEKGKVKIKTRISISVCSSGITTFVIALPTAFVLRGAIILCLQWPFSNGCEMSPVIPFPCYVLCSCSVATHTADIFLLQHQEPWLWARPRTAHLQLLTAECCCIQVEPGQDRRGTQPQTSASSGISWYLRSPQPNCT